MGGSGSGKPKKLEIKKLIKEILPKGDIFNDEEAQMYEDFISAYLTDFDQDDLTSSDMDDIMNLSLNKVLSFRLLKGSKDNVDKQLDIASALEKLDKRSEKIKESLSSRRKDRIDPNELKGFSIIDLAIAYDQSVKAGHVKRMEQLKKEEQDALDRRSDYHGNRYDLGGDTKDKDSNE